MKFTIPNLHIMPILQPVPISTRGLGCFTGLYKWLTAKRVWKVQEDWYFCLPGMHYTFVIPHGFVFDGASIPRMFWWFLSPTGIMLIPGLIHDFTYRYDFVLVIQDGEKVPTQFHFGKRHWDKLFREVACEVNHIFILHWIVWVCVAGGGYFAWKKNRNLNAEIYWDKM